MVTLILWFSMMFNEKYIFNMSTYGTAIIAFNGQILFFAIIKYLCMIYVSIPCNIKPDLYSYFFFQLKKKRLLNKI